jgi:PAS domain S-box-containing protein
MLKLFLIITLFFNSFLFAETFTKEEKNFLKSLKEIKVCVNNDWIPIEFRDNKGVPKGISIDTLKIVADKLQIKLNFIKTDSWFQSQQFLKEKKCDILPSAVKTDERLKYAIFTKPYLNYKLAIITKDDKPLVQNLESILDKTMVRKKGSGLISKLKKLYPNINIKETDNFEETFKMISNGEAYYTIATLPVVEYYKNRYKLKNLQLAGYTDLIYKLGIAVRKDKPLLRSILCKTLQTIPKITQKIIYEKWTKKPINNYDKYRKIILTLIIILFIIIIFFIYKNYYLNKQIEKATKLLKEQNRVLEEKNANIQVLLDATMEGIVITENFIIKSVNKSALKIAGFDNENEVIGKNLLSLLGTPNDVQKVTKQIKENEMEPYEVIGKKKDGSTYIALAQGKNLIIDGKKLRVSTFIDLTATKEKDKLIFQQSKMAAMGEMIGNIAHQWRQPLNALSLYISNCQLDYEFGDLTQEKMEEFQNKSNELIQKMSQTINDFRNFLSPNKKKEKFSILKIIEDSLRFIEGSFKANDIQIINHIVNDIEIEGFPNELIQVLLNILNNSKDALKTRKIENRKIILNLIETDKEIKIIIKDNGGGIPEEIIDRVCEPYFTTKFKSEGTGLGLYMSKMIIETSFQGKLLMENIEQGLKTTIILNK